MKNPCSAKVSENENENGGVVAKAKKVCVDRLSSEGGMKCIELIRL